MTIVQTPGSVLQQPAYQLFIASALHMGEDELAGWVDKFRFPSRLSFIAGIAVSFIGLQGVYLHSLYPFIVKGLSMFTQPLIQPAHRTGIDPDQTRRSFQRATFRQMFADSHRLGFAHLGVPQRRILPFTELAATSAAAQIANLVLAVYLTHGQILLTGLPVQFATHIDTC